MFTIHEENISCSVNHQQLVLLLLLHIVCSAGQMKTVSHVNTLARVRHVFNCVVFLLPECLFSSVTVYCMSEVLHAGAFVFFSQRGECMLFNYYNSH